MCHPPLIAHNLQRTLDMSPYIMAEQDKRLQQMIDANKNIIFISGHTHMIPDVAFDEIHKNLYINDGSICPTTTKDGKIQQGNVTLLDINEKGISVIVKGIHTDKIFIDKFVE